MPGKVIVFEPDLMFSSRVESAVAKCGFDASVTTNMEELETALRSFLPVALFANLDAVPNLESSSFRSIQRECRMFGYYSHVNSHVALEALAAGFDEVMPRRTFMLKLSELLAGLTLR